MKPKKLLSFLLATAMTISFLPTFTLTASADETPTTTAEKNITLGTSALKGRQASNVYFGNYQQSSLGNTKPTTGTEGIDWINSTTATKNSQGPYYSKEPIKWRVLSNDGSKLFLLSDKNLDVIRYNTESVDVTWETSIIRSWLNDNFINTAFDTAEKSFIADTNVVNADNSTFNIEGGNNTTDKVFLLSTDEAQDASYFTNDNSRKAFNTAYVYGGGENGADKMSTVGYSDYWWLRSPGIATNYAAGVYDLGSVNNVGIQVGYAKSAVRPAFNLNLSSVLFTSTALGGKSGNVGTLSANAENAGNEYKLTMKDSTRSGFTAKATNVSENILTVSYTNAKAGENEYISVIIVNADGEVTYYGKIANVENKNGTVALNLTGITVASTDKIYIFNEQINGDYKTDFASELKEVTIETKVTLTKDKVSVYLVDKNATLIVASYKGEALKDIKTIPLTSKIYEKTLDEIGLDTNGADTIKAFLWTDITTLTPLCEAKEVTLGE